MLTWGVSKEAVQTTGWFKKFIKSFDPIEYDLRPLVDRESFGHETRETDRGTFTTFYRFFQGNLEWIESHRGVIRNWKIVTPETVEKEWRLKHVVVYQA